MEKISKLIRSLLNGKILGLNSILNKVFKVVALIIIKDLAEIASCHFTNGIILKHLKKSITIVLRKKGFFLNSYKLIIFKNILVKVLKKHVANIIFKVVEEYRLLFWN